MPARRCELANPQDPLLQQGASTTAVKATTRGASLALQVLQNYPVTPSRAATVTESFTHDRVDPLFGSVALTTKADLLQNTFGAAATLGEITAQYRHTRTEENLDGYSVASRPSASRSSSSWRPRLKGPSVGDEVGLPCN